jgi:hypothetical protein
MGGTGVRWRLPLPSTEVASTDRPPGAACHNRAVTAVLIRRGNLARLAAGPVAFAVGLGALAIAQGPGRSTTYPGRSSLLVTLMVAWFTVAAAAAYPAAVETCAYLLVAEALQDAAGRGATQAMVATTQDGGRLVVTVDDDGGDRGDAMVQLADRVGALDGRLTVQPTRLRAELPCG